MKIYKKIIAFLADKKNWLIWKFGHCVYLTHSLRAEDAETWVKMVAQRSGQWVDWHWMGGHVRVVALGNLSKVYAALEYCRQKHDLLLAGEFHRNFPKWGDEAIAVEIKRIGFFC